MEKRNDLFSGKFFWENKGRMDHLNIPYFVKAGHCLEKLTAKTAICHEAENDWQHLPAETLPEAKVFSVQH